MSYAHHSGLAGQWDSQAPLSWDIPCPHTGQRFLDSLPRLSQVMANNRSYSDFDIFKATLNAPDFLTTLEARHYLTIAFSHYSIAQIQQFEQNLDWNWYRWIKAHSGNIAGALSLNYDLLLETVLRKVRKESYSFQVNHHGYGIPLVKPHGSVDFEITPNSISYTPTYPLRNFVDLNDTGVIKLGQHDLLSARRQALCIVPNEANKYIGYQWVNPANQALKQVLRDCTHCIFVGISYFECDQREIDDIIDSLPDAAQVVIANPTPPPAMLDKIGNRPLLLWGSYSGPVDNNNNLIMLKAKDGASLAQCMCKSGLSYVQCHGKSM